MKTHLKHATSGNNSARHCAKFRGKDVAKFANEILSRYSNMKFCHGKVRRGLIFHHGLSRKTAALQLKLERTGDSNIDLRAAKTCLRDGSHQQACRRAIFVSCPNRPLKNSLSELGTRPVGTRKGSFMVPCASGSFMVPCASGRPGNFQSSKIWQKLQPVIKKPVGKS